MPDSNCLRRWTAAAAIFTLAACSGEPLGPVSLVLDPIRDTADSVLVGAPARPLAKPVAFRARDAWGHPLAGVTVRWDVRAGNGYVERASEVTDRDGMVQADWVLGSRAGTGHQLDVTVKLGPRSIGAQVKAVAIPVEVASLSILAETTQVRVAVPGQVRAEATDPFGNKFVPSSLQIGSLDTSIVVADSLEVRARRRGYARVVATAGGVADTAWIHAIQVVRSILAQPDTLMFHSIGQRQPVGFTLVDDQGLAVPDSFPLLDLARASVVAAQLNTVLSILSVSEGYGTLTLRAGTVTQDLVVSVAQQAASATLSAIDRPLDAINDTVSLRLTVRDSIGVPLVRPQVSFVSRDTGV